MSGWTRSLDEETTAMAGKASQRKPVEVQGVEWCIEHHGVVDECSSYSPGCDMADGMTDECRVVQVFYFEEAS